MDNQSESPAKRPRISFHPPQNFDALPPVIEAQKQIFNEPLPETTAADFSTRYPNFSAETQLLIYRTMKYMFRKFQITERWTAFKDDAPYQPRLEDYGVAPDSPLEQRLTVIHRLGASSKTNSAFNPLKELNEFLSIPNTPTVEDTITNLLAEKNNPQIIDIGCGGQGAEIELLTKPAILGKNVQMIGIGAFDYGKNLRPEFPELVDTLIYREANVYLDEFPENSADFVFSARTLPYTGVIDAKQFCAAAHKMAKPDAYIRIDDIEANNFDFKASGFTNLEEYLKSLQAHMPHLQFSKDRGNYIISWLKSEGFPLNDFEAKSILTDDILHLPYQITYSLNRSKK